MKKFFIMILFLTGILFMACSTKVNTDKRVLIYTKNGEGYVHDNISASVDALVAICNSNGIMTDVTDDPSVFTIDKLKTYRAVVFSNTNNEAFDTDEQRDAFLLFIQGGGGFIGIHSACGSERDWPWFWAMLGGRFMRHPKFQPFTIKIIDHNHPSTEFLNDTWAWEDECYFMDNLNPDIRVLLAADLTTVDDPDRQIYPGKTFGDLFPLAWYHEYDGGRQFYTALGHQLEHYSDPQFLKHLEGGLLWVLQEK